MPRMGQVIAFAAAAEARDDRIRAARRAALLAVPDHPALRWLAGDTWWLAHRRDPDAGGAGCGAPGELTLATRAVPLCLDCYPPVREPGGP